MGKIRFLSVFLLFLAVVLFFPACEDGPPDGGGTTNTDTGSLFYAKAADGKHVFISIYSYTRAITPKTGDFYAVAVVTINAAGESDYNDVPTSEGTISVAAAGALTFTPYTEYPAGAGTGTLSGNTLSMAKVPGTTYTNLEMTFYSNITGNPNLPLGPSDLTPPDEGTPPPGGTSPPLRPPAAITFPAG
jgi:hypothetical protein